VRMLAVDSFGKSFWKCLHIVTACLWLGGGASVLLLLALDSGTRNGDELFAFNQAIRAIDAWLIVPSAALNAGSGLALCRRNRLGIISCRWVVTKWVVTLAAILFGAVCLGPWLLSLSRLAGLNRLAVFDNFVYYRTYHLGTIAGALQAIVLLYLVVMSVLKPCAVTGGNCTLCREKS
jgi:hypothetical protein